MENPHRSLAALGALLLACAPGVLPVATGASPAAPTSAAGPGTSAPGSSSGASAPGSSSGMDVAVPPPGASTSASPSVQGDAPPGASARWLPEGCPAPLDGVTGVELADPLGPASEESSVEPPRCYPKIVVYGRYRNGRFALAADVPGFLARHGAEAANGDGATFQLGPELTIAVWGAHNLDLSMEPGMTQEKSLRNRLSDARKVAPGGAPAAGGARGQRHHSRQRPRRRPRPPQDHPRGWPGGIHRGHLPGASRRLLRTHRPARPPLPPHHQRRPLQPPAKAQSPRPEGLMR
jgi:hypothetical protein